MKMLLTCPHCKQGKVTFNKLWLIDVDTYLKCTRCKARLAHVHFVVTALLYALGIALTYVVFQRWGMQHGITEAKHVALAFAVLMYAVVNLLRLGLLWLLWLIKIPLFSESKRRQQQEEETWRKPFVEDE
jgi:hypothetical protein